MSVDELARAADTTTRNVRALQSMGLLHAPFRVGRRGSYDRTHLERLRAILRLQHSGFSLGSIGLLLEGWERGLTLGQVLGLEPLVPSTGPSGGEGGEEWPEDLYPLAEWPVPAPSGRPRLVVLLPSPLLEEIA
jgi:DNA-binding transcriptional MerR regulator